jgi:hypothetical protein
MNEALLPLGPIYTPCSLGPIKSITVESWIFVGIIFSSFCHITTLKYSELGSVLVVEIPYNIKRQRQ